MFCLEPKVVSSNPRENPFIGLWLQWSPDDKKYKNARTTKKNNKKEKKEKNIQIIIDYFFSTGQAPFPSMTICPHYNSAYKRDLLSNSFQLTIDDVRKKLVFPKVEHSNFSLSKVFEQMTFEWEEMIVLLAIKTGLKMENSNFTIFLFVNDHQNRTNGKTGQVLQSDSS